MLSSRADGYAIEVDPDLGGKTQEWDTCQCGHCQRIIFTKPGSLSRTYLVQDPVTAVFIGEEPGAFCRNCMRPVCLPCHDIGTCTPFEKALESYERRHAKLFYAVLLSVGLATGTVQAAVHGDPPVPSKVCTVIDRALPDSPTGAGSWIKAALLDFFDCV